MMHAVLASLGTDGDVLPFVGLGVALKARGHRVTLVAAENYSDLAGAHWLEFQQLVSAETMRDLLGHPDFWHPIKTARRTARWGAGMIGPQYTLLSGICAGPGTVLIANPAILAAMLAREKLGIPLATVVLQPWMIPSASAPPLMPIPGLPRWAPPIMHTMAFRVIGMVADALVGPALNRVRRSLGLKPKGRILKDWLSRELTLGMFPEWYGPPQADWPVGIALTGFPRFDGAIQRGLPPGLPEFLGGPKPTVVFTFGSGMMHGGQLFETASRVCGRLDAQGLFLSRHHEPVPSARMFHAGFIPFREVFPECAAVAHHGGIGTTAEGLAAGVPQLILPLGFDQLDNGARVERMGAGLHTASMHRLVARGGSPRERDVEEIAGKLRQLLAPEFRKKAGVARERIRAENALERGATLVEEFAAGR